MEKMKGETFPVVEDNLRQLKRIFPDVFTEDRIDLDKLMLTIGEHIEREKQRYEFSWTGKTKALQLALKTTTGTLRPCKEDSVNWDETRNLYIEGDNLEVLRILQSSYRNKIQLIYIDPPYNTGKDFVYKDDFRDNLRHYIEKNGEQLKSNPETSGRYHTDWLNMMYPRLRIARNLMREDGVICISIDENEMTNLKKLCDEIFGEMNHVITVIVNRTSEIASNYTISKHEYLLVYAKNMDRVGIQGKPKYTISRGTVGNPNQTMPVITFPKGLKCYGIKDGVYETTRKIDGSSENIENLDPIIVKNGELAEPVRLKARWRSSNDMRNFFENGCRPTKAKISGEIVEIYFENDRFNPQIKKKTFEKLPSLYLENKRGSKDLEELGMDGYLPYPKSVSFMKYILSFFPKDCTVLDFFSGSATTAHAVMEANGDDGGNRRFIMVQLPEETDLDSPAYEKGMNTICEIGKERIRRAGKKIVEERQLPTLDIGFKVFRLDDTNIRMWDGETVEPERDLLDFIDPVKEGRTEEDVLYEILLKYGIDITLPVEERLIGNRRGYVVEKGRLFICLEKDLSLETIEEIGKQKPARVVFYDESFQDDTVRINAEQVLKRYGVHEVRVI